MVFQILKCYNCLYLKKKFKKDTHHVFKTERPQCHKNPKGFFKQHQHSEKQDQSFSSGPLSFTGPHAFSGSQQISGPKHWQKCSWKNSFLHGDPGVYRVAVATLDIFETKFGHNKRCFFGHKVYFKMELPLYTYI